ncbi:AI-2E family transporter [Phocaeicola massiliensis]|jgi:predicted PurR-regulated permease PerM|uniref:AI-2E family transporter n=1 Tax=Phocaeicola massiliensis TaxID=204516 RepID=UPI0015B3C64C|nr:AI-2E family transporter [Phocaeicola massiliensis]
MSVKEQYRKYSLITIILGLGLLLFLKMTPFMGGILGACTIYIMVRDQMLYLTQKKKIRKSVTAIILLIEAILCFLVPLSLAVWLLISKLQTVNVDTATFVDTITNLADWIHRKTEYDLLSKENISSIASILPGIGQFLMGGISSFAVNLFVLVFVLYFMLIGGTKMEQYIYELLPFSDSNKKHVMNEINMIVRANAIGIPLLAIIQGAIATLGYYLFDAPSALLFGFLTCFATVIPIVGTTLVWFPLAAYMAISGDWPHAIGLLLYCGLIVTNIDNLIRFILQKKMADTHPLITIFGVVIGLSLFGFMGVIFGPLLISIFILCVNIFKEQYLK